MIKTEINDLPHKKNAKTSVGQLQYFFFKEINDNFCSCIFPTGRRDHDDQRDYSLVHNKINLKNTQTKITSKGIKTKGASNQP